MSRKHGPATQDLDNKTQELQDLPSAHPGA